MKIIQTIIAVLLMAVTVSAQIPTTPSTGGGGGSSPTRVFNSVSLARAFLFAKTDHYRGSFYGQTEKGGDLNASFVMNKQFNITRLAINGEFVPLPGFLRGIPVGQLGAIRNFSIYLEAVDESGRVRGRGNFWKDILFASDSISIQLSPEGIKQLYRYDGDIQNVNVVPENFGDFFGSSYNHDLGGFIFEVDPDATDVSVKIVDRTTGEVISVIRIPSAFQNAVATGEAPVNVILEGGVVEIFLDNNQSHFDEVPFNSLVDNRPTKVFFGDVGGARLHMAIGSRIPLSHVQVFHWTPEGQMPQVPMNWVTEVHEGGWRVFNGVSSAGASLGKVIIVVSQVDKNFPTIPWIAFTRSEGGGFSPTTGEPLP